jgi:quinol monooxygenase YgiN
MTTIDVVAILKAKSGSETIVEEGLTALAAPSRQEEGCLSYELYVSTAEPGTFVTVEQWQSQADLDAHMATPHLAAAIASGAEHFADAPVIHVLRHLES